MAKYVYKKYAKFMENIHKTICDDETQTNECEKK
jgi:hypothetical protein